MTVRNNKNKIIEFSYGDDNFDTIKVESIVLPFIDMTNEEIYNYYQTPTSDKDILSTVFTKDVQKKNKKDIKKG